MKVPRKRLRFSNGTSPRLTSTSISALFPIRAALSRLNHSANDTGTELDWRRSLVAHRYRELIADFGRLEVHVSIDAHFRKHRSRHFPAAHELRRIPDLDVLDPEVERRVRRNYQTLRAKHVLRRGWDATRRARGNRRRLKSERESPTLA